MKRCPQCQQEYPPNVKFCPRDGTAVEEIGGEADPLVGRLLGGRYLVEKRVGSGGFGTVYRVRDQRFHDVPKALKIIHRRHAQDRIAMERFHQEAQLLFDLGKRSTAIVQFYDFEEDPQEGLF
ncbi:MAG: inactive serine/threonine-protein kinase VRK3, partial [Candidatus Acidoferrales bacterium]